MCVRAFVCVLTVEETEKQHWKYFASCRTGRMGVSSYEALRSGVENGRTEARADEQAEAQAGAQADAQNGQTKAGAFSASSLTAHTHTTIMRKGLRV